MVELATSYRSKDGKLHGTLEDAVKHELVCEVDSWLAEPTYEFKHVARYLQVPENRARFRAILEQFDG